MSRLYKGDCLQIMKKIGSDKIDLIYLDPPFGTGKEWKADKGGFSDKWNPHNVPEAEYEMLLNYDKRLHDRIEIMTEIHSLDMQAYIVFMANRLIEMKRILKETGSIYLHCDPTASHYLKIVMDSIFDKSNFRNEIVWKRKRSVGISKKKLPKSHDLIYLYSKSEIYKFNIQYTNYDKKYLDRAKKDENGRLYISTPTGNPAYRPTLYYEYKGYLPPQNGYMWTHEKMKEYDQQNRLVFPKKKTGRIQFKKYLDEMKGMKLQDVWTDIPIVNPVAKERLGYPTQKPVALLERIIKASSNEGDIVLDPFCGSGTTLEASHKLNRRWIGIDISEQAVNEIIPERLNNRCGLTQGKDYKILNI